MGLCKKTLRVSKVATRKKNGRGRPQVYSESWKKKVIVLRSCGLELKVILDILTTSGGLIFKAKIRRAQQIIQEYLADENERFIPPDKETARSIARFIRAKRPYNNKSPAHTSHPLERGVTTTSEHSPLSSLSGESAWSTTQSPYSEALSQVMSDQGKQRQQSDLDIQESEGPTLRDIVNQDPDLSSRLTQVGAGSNILHQGSSTEIVNLGRQFLTKDRLRLSLRRLSNASLSSSLLSDIVSLMGRRYSCSSFDTTNESAMSALSGPVTESKPVQDRVKKVLRLRQQEAVAENTALINRCCHSHCCLHQFIREFIRQHTEFNNSPRFAPFSSDPTSDYPHVARWQSNAVTDTEKNDALFFAARVGAPAEVLITLMQSATNLEYVNKNGQTWLHCLDPRLLKMGLCLCYPSVHCSELECVMSSISPDFPIDRIDDHGRHFLFYICYSSAFDIRLLVQLIQRFPEWKERVISASQLRDRAGLFLWDYMSTHPSFSTLSESVQSLFRPKVDPYLWKQHVRILHDEDSLGKTELHRYLGTTILKNLNDDLSPPVGPAVVRQDINRYDRMGLTPLLAFVKLAFENGNKEDAICAKIRQFVALGANVNARSQKGATILHFIAKIGAASLLKTLIDEFGARVDVCDDRGCSAQDYLAEEMKVSQTAKRSAQQLARSVKAARTLLSAKNPVDLVQIMQADASVKALVLGDQLNI